MFVFEFLNIDLLFIATGAIYTAYWSNLIKPKKILQKRIKLFSD